jgi:hypothetical protein
VLNSLLGDRGLNSSMTIKPISQPALGMLGLLAAVALIMWIVQQVN